MNGYSPLCFFLCYLTCEVQFVGDWNTDSAKKKHHESDSTPCLMEWKAKKMWTAIKKGEKTLEALTLFSRVMKNISPDQRIHCGGGTARPPSAPLSLACCKTKGQISSWNTLDNLHDAQENI